MANALIELLKREQVKLARNTFELASFYCPMGRVPDLIDFTMMQKRLELLQQGKTNAKDLWPQASEAFAAKLKSRIDYTLEQAEAVVALSKTCKDGDGLSLQDQYHSGLKNSRLYQIHQSDPTDGKVA